MRDAAASPEHHLSVSQTVSPQPESVIYDPLATVLPEASAVRGHTHAHSESEMTREPKKSTSAASLWPFHRHAHSHEHGILNHHFLQLIPSLPISQTTPTTPNFACQADGLDDSEAETTRKTRDMDLIDSSRSKSVDRGLFSSTDKRAGLKVGVSTTVAPGSVQVPPRHGRPVKSVDLGKGTQQRCLETSLLSSPLAAAAGSQHNRTQSDSNHIGEAHACKIRPRPVQRMDSAPITKTPPPSEVTSSVSAHPSTGNTSERMLAFQSDPSLPALLSGASSVPADMEAKLLCKPGIVSTHPKLLETTDSLTPPAVDKEPASGYPIGQAFGNPPAMDSGSLAVHLEGGARDSVTSTSVARPVDDDFDDNEILLMAKAKKKLTQPTPRPPAFNPQRRDTNISIASTETAKKVPTSTYGDEGTSPYET